MLRLDVADIAYPMGNVLGHLCLEGTLPYKDHDGMELIWPQSQQRLQGLHMFVVLMQRILKFLRMPVDLLGPGLLLLTAEDPPLHVLGLHHEHPIG